MVCLSRSYHFKCFKDCLPQILLVNSWILCTICYLFSPSKREVSFRNMIPLFVFEKLLWWWWWWWWWLWWSVSAEWLSGERRLALFPGGTFVRDARLARIRFRLCWMKLRIVITTTPLLHVILVILMDPI